MGQELTVESIVRNHGKRLFNLAYRICGDEFLAQDLLQESLLQIHRALPSFHGNSSTYTWAYKVTLNTCLKRSRGKEMRTQAEAALQRLGSQEEAALMAADGDEPNDILVEKALMAEIREKCHYFMTFLLTEEQRVALLLKDLFDFSYQEMSYLLEVTEDVIRSRLSRARASLRRHFERRCSWLRPGNACRCESRVGYVLGKYPSLAKKLAARTSRSEYNQAIARQLGRKIGSEDDIIASFPLLEFKARKSLAAILKGSDTP
jgi:RNA polymerase sigma-70 factor (ECF subfamily)